jgi:hypothetical protein
MLQNLDVFLTKVKWGRGLFSPNFASGNKTFLLLTKAVINFGIIRHGFNLHA